MTPNVRLANTAWEALFTAHTTVIRGLMATDAWGDISMREYDVLYTLSKHDRPVRLGELRDGVLLSQPALSRLIDRLVDRDLVIRNIDDADRRAVGLELTDRGREVQREVGRAHAVDVTQSMQVLSAEELRTLKSLCDKLTEAQR